MIDCRHATCADGPNWLIGEDYILQTLKTLGRAKDLTAHHIQRTIIISLLLGFPDAQDGRQTCQAGLLRFGSDVGVGFTVIRAALGMADDDISRARFGDHLCAEIACVCARGCHVAILRADCHSVMHSCKGRQQRGRWANHDVCPCVRSLANMMDLIGHGTRSVHFPIANRKFPTRHCVPLGMSVILDLERWFLVSLALRYP